MDVPEDAEIGTDGAGLALLAILGTNVHQLEAGRMLHGAGHDLYRTVIEGRATIAHEALMDSLGITY